MPDRRAPRNRTLTLTAAERARFAARLLRLDSGRQTTLSEIENRIICGDIRETATNLPHGFVDLLIADPPYNLTKNYHGRTFRETDRDAYEQWTESWLVPLLPLLKPAASVYVCCDWKSSAVIESVLSRHLTIRNRISWQREKGRGAAKNWKNCVEDIWFATNNDTWHFDADAVRLRRKVLAPYREEGAPKDWKESGLGKYRDTAASNFWDDLTIPFWSMPENTDHPTQKPEKLAARLILASCPPDGLVFDPFLGSGTSAVTAKKLGRRFCGVEINEEYCAWAEKRLEDANTNKRIQGYRDGIFLERNNPGIK